MNVFEAVPIARTGPAQIAERRVVDLKGVRSREVAILLVVWEIDRESEDGLSELIEIGEQRQAWPIGRSNSAAADGDIRVSC